MGEGGDSIRDKVSVRLGALRQHQRNGRRSPHKPLLLLLALGRLHTLGSSALPWSEGRDELADLIAEFGPTSKTGRTQSAAYPFTHLRSDGVWILDHDVPMDTIGPLTTHQVTGRLDPALEAALEADPALIEQVAWSLADSHFPSTVAPDVLAAVGFDPEQVQRLAAPPIDAEKRRRRERGWRDAVLQAWDRQCAFCGFDGQALGATVGIDAAHVRWFAFDGPDTLDNGLALCTLHHKLFDRGVLGLDTSHTINVSAVYTARTHAGRAIYDMHGRALDARPGTPMPAEPHIAWHTREVFKGQPLRGRFVSFWWFVVAGWGGVRAGVSTGGVVFRWTGCG